MMKRAQIAGLLLLAVTAAPNAEAKVKATVIAEVVRSADAIVLARVTNVIKGNRDSHGTIAKTDVAVAEVLEQWKGEVGQTVEFSVQNPWPCDVSRAVVDERAVLILSRKYKGEERVRVWPGLYFLSFYGRGRMPIVNRDGKTFARVQAEVVLPKLDVEFLSSPDYPEDNLVELDKLRAYVKAILTPNAAQHGVAPDGRSPAAPARR
jgi:hypothetical protein